MVATGRGPVGDAQHDRDKAFAPETVMRFVLALATGDLHQRLWRAVQAACDGPVSAVRTVLAVRNGPALSPRYGLLLDAGSRGKSGVGCIQGGALI